MAVSSLSQLSFVAVDNQKLCLDFFPTISNKDTF